MRKEKADIHTLGVRHERRVNVFSTLFESRVIARTHGPRPRDARGLGGCTRAYRAIRLVEVKRTDVYLVLLKEGYGHVDDHACSETL